MEVGIMGLAASGKSTLFGLLTGQDPDAPAARHGSVQIGIARVPDPRLDALSAMYHPEKTTPATVRYVDVPGIPEEHRQEAAFNLPELRAVDALMVVVRAFENDAVAHPKGVDRSATGPPIHRGRVHPPRPAGGGEAPGANPP